MDIEDRIENCLLDLGFAQHFRGYSYIVEAVTTIVESKDFDFCMQDLYKQVANICSTLPNRVERCIRSAIEQTWANIYDEDTRKKIFGNGIQADKAKPTNKHFIAAVARYILREHRKESLQKDT